MFLAHPYDYDVINTKGSFGFQGVETMCRLWAFPSVGLGIFVFALGGRSNYKKKMSRPRGVPPYRGEDIVALLTSL